MDPREIVDAYLNGRIESWGVFRKLVRLGVSTATALAVVTALPAAVSAQDTSGLNEIAQVATDDKESEVLIALIKELASQIQKVEGGASIRPLAATLARIGSQNWNLTNCNECDPIKLNINDGVNNLSGALVVTGRQNNITLNLNGSIGQSNVSLAGTFDPPNNNNSPRDPASNPQNTGRVNLNSSATSATCR